MQESCAKMVVESEVVSIPKIIAPFPGLCEAEPMRLAPLQVVPSRQSVRRLILPHDHFNRVFSETLAGQFSAL